MYLNKTKKTFNFLKKTALYSDTTIINDPILSELMALQLRGTGEGQAFHIVAQYALQLLANKELFDSDVNPPICYLAPSTTLILQERHTYEATQNLVENHIVPLYSSLLFNRSFSSAEEVFNFLEKFKNFKEFLSEVQKSDVPIINPDGTMLTEEKCISIRDYYEEKYCQQYPLSGVLFAIIRGRFSMASYDIAVNGRYTSNFVTDFKGVWNSLLLLLKNDSEIISQSRGKPTLSKDALILNVLHDKSLNWLGDVPLDKIKKMRENGELQEMRDIIGKNIDKIQTTDETEFAEVGRQVKYNLNEAFKRHNAEIKTLDEKYKKQYQIDASTTVVSGVLGLASSVYPPLAVVAGIVGGRTVIDIVRNYFAKRGEVKYLRRKPVAMLFEVHNKVQTPS